MNKFGRYIKSQVSRPFSLIAYDVCIVTGFGACIYFAFIR